MKKEESKDIKAIIFDLDNTLIDRQRAFREMLMEVFSSFFDDADLVAEMIKDVMEYDTWGYVSREESLTRWAEKYHITDIDPLELAQNWSKISGSTVYLFDDVIPSLSELKKKYRLALLTNGNSSSQRRKINNTGIADMFEYTLVSGEYEVNKPDPRIFQHACQQLNLDESECIYVGDNYITDIEGAIKAGLVPVYVNRRHDVHDDVINIREIKDLLSIL